MKTLLYITIGYPCTTFVEQSFIEPEVNVLAKLFDKVIFLPIASHAGEELNVNLPDNVEIDCRQMHRKHIFPRFREMFRPELLHYLIHDIGKLHTKEQVKHAGLFLNESIELSKWIERNYLPTVDDLTIYTFWFDIGTTAAAMLVDKYRLKVVTRAHRFDIYDDATVFRSHFLRSYTLKRLKGVFPCSDDGTEYIRSDYPKYSDRIHTAYLGSQKSIEGVCLPNDDDNTTTFFSCSRMAEVKRVPLIASSLIHLANVHPDHHFEWLHIGGDAKEEAGAMIMSMPCPTNLEIKLLGSMENTRVQEFYVSHKIDWFISMSSSEGLPISICEAISYGVPVVATNVGGISEIVTKDVGVLLSSSPIAVELSEKLSPFIENKSTCLLLRQNAISRWKLFFDSSITRDEFAKIISQL